MEKSMNICPQCREPYSSSLPKTQHYSRCGLPLTLHCGHGVCYHCVVSKRSHSKYGLTNKGPDSTTISCAVCKCVSIIPHEAVRNVLAVINCYQLGLIQLNDLGIDMAGENIGFKDGNGGLFVPSGQELVVERPQPLSPPEKCPIHNTTMNFWCYTDEALLCGGCRISSHLGHDVVKIEDRNKEELDSFYEAANAAVEFIGEMEKTCSDIKEQSGRVKSEYDSLIRSTRSYFSDLHSLLAAKEQQVQHELFQKFQERSASLNHAERYIREGYLDISIRLQKATKAVSSYIPPSRSAISRLTESIRQSSSCKNLVAETRNNLNSVTLSAVLEQNEKFAYHLRDHPVATVTSEYEGSSYWNRLLSQFGDFKQEKDRQSLDHFNSTSPCEPSEKKRARKHTHVNQLPLTLNQYENGMKLTGRVVHVDSERFYIQIQSSTNPNGGKTGCKELDELQTRIQTCESKPAPRLDELHAGQLVTGLFNRFWYRALIEEVNIKCNDLAIFFVDYGNRMFTTAQSIRLLGDNMSDLPAQAVRCAQTESKSLISVSKFINVHVDRVEPGGVGRLNGQEYTLFVTVDPLPIDEGKPSQISPPREPVDPFTAYPPSRLHKVVRTIPTPPPPEAIVAKRKRFPAKDWVPRSTNSVPSDPSNGHRCHPVAITESSIQSSTISAVKSKPVLYQSPVYLPPPPALYEGQENRFRTKIIVSHLNSPGDFHVWTNAAEKMYAEMTRQLDLHFANSSLLLELLKPAELKTVGLVCATNADGQWNRCLIVDIVDDTTVTVRLTDVGKKIKANYNQLFRLDQSRWKTPGLAWECRLWGVRPAGHLTKWSGSATDKMKRVIKASSALFMQAYYVLEEEIGDTGIFQPINYVRFFHEYIKPGGPLEFDQTLTGCLNDELVCDDIRLAFRDPMLVTVQPTPKRWLPSVTLPPELERAMPVWMDEDGLIYFHRPIGPTNHVATINKLISWHYEKSTPTAADLASWVKDEPCIVLYTDRIWYRAIVLSADDEAQSASVLFVDYGNSEQVPYQNMRKSLLCYEYPIQANRCRLSRYPGPETKPSESELELLHELLIDKKITVRVIDPASNESDPVVDIWFSDENGKDLKEIFGQLRPGYKYSSTPPKASGSPVNSSPLALITPPPTVPLSSVDLDDSIFDVESEFSDDVYPIFNFDVIHESKETDVYRPLLIPRRVSLPIHFISVNCTEYEGVFSPQRYTFRDSPRVWQEQVENYASLHTELQRAAPLFPDVGVVESGSPCACHDEKTDRWHRGKVLGYVDDDLRSVQVELVDLGINKQLPSCKIKQLPFEYLSLPRHSTKAKLIDPMIPLLHRPNLDLVHSLVKRREGNHFVAFFREVNEPLQMTLLYKTSDGKVIRAIE